MWGLFRMIHQTNQRQFCKTVIFKFTDQYISCIQLPAKCHRSNVNDASQGSIQVYYGNLTPQMRAVKIFSLLSSVTGLVSQPILINQVPNLGTPVVVALFGFVGFFTYVTPILLHIITKKEKKITFTTDDVVVPDVPGMFTSFQIKGTPLFVDPRLFDEPDHYAKIMGYDKPIDFKLSDTSAQKTKPIEKVDSA